MRRETADFAPSRLVQQVQYQQGRMLCCCVFTVRTVTFREAAPAAGYAFLKTNFIIVIHYHIAMHVNMCACAVFCAVLYACTATVCSVQTMSYCGARLRRAVVLSY